MMLTHLIKLEIRYLREMAFGDIISKSRQGVVTDEDFPWVASM
jgi:hypothetical protein